MAYDKFTILKSTAYPLPIENVDTDQIIPARFLKATERKGFGDKLGLIPGGKKGSPKKTKHILGDFTWADIQIAVTQDSKQYNRLCNAYAAAKRKESEIRYRQKHGGQSPSLAKLAVARKNAIQNFIKHVKKM